MIQTFDLTSIIKIIAFIFFILISFIMPFILGLIKARKLWFEGTSAFLNNVAMKEKLDKINDISHSNNKIPFIKYLSKKQLTLLIIGIVIELFICFYLIFVAFDYILLSIGIFILAILSLIVFLIKEKNIYDLLLSAAIIRLLYVESTGNFIAQMAFMSITKNGFDSSNKIHTSIKENIDETYNDCIELDKILNSEQILLNQFSLNGDYEQIKKNIFQRIKTTEQTFDYLKKLKSGIIKN